MRKIRILHVVIEMGLGGYENYIMNIFRHIDRTKFQFDFLVFKSRRAYFENEIENLGGKVYHCTFSDDFNLFKLKKDLKNYFANNHYDILHCHNRHYSPFYLRPMSKYADKVIIHAHTANKEKTLKGFLVWMLGQYPSKNKKYYRLACSKVAGDFVFGKQSKYELCPNCIEAEKFSYDEASRHQMRKEFGIDENDVVIGHIGRFAPVKNHPFILKIFEKIVLIENNTKLCLCGVGADKDKIISIVNANETIKNNVVFLPVGDVSKYYSLFDVFILPSYHEGFPLSLLESQASGCLSFASDTITREVQLSDLVEYIKIDDEQKWIDNITSSFCRLKNIERKKYNLVIKESPYDVDCATCFLVSYYERVLKEHLKS